MLAVPMLRYFLAISLTLPIVAFAKENPKFMTSLDKAHVTAMKTKQETVFYNAFLSSTIFIATADSPSTEKNKRAGSNETISPIIIESNGEKYVMLFDTKERLAAWAQREVSFAALPGHAIVEMMGTDFHWALNVGTDYVKTFVPDEISWLKQNLTKAQAERVSAGTKVLIGAPAKTPNGLIEALKKTISSRNPEVKTAYLGQVFYVRDGEKPHLALVIEVSTKDNVIIDAICQDLAISTKGLLGEGEYIDIMVNDGNDTALEITKAVKPFYSKRRWN
jgi:hypothetical protein